MNARHVLAVACLSALLNGAHARTFTNSAGKQIEAELIAVEDGNAVLKLQNQRTAKVPLTALSAEDQEYAKTWHEENKNKISERDIDLDIKKTSKKTDSSRNDGGGGKGGKGNTSKSSTTEVTFTCTLKNSSLKTIEGMTAAYTIYKRTSTRGGDDSGTSTSETSDTTEVPTVKPRESVEFALDPVECTDSSKKSKNGPSSSQRETVTGVVITLSIGDKEVLKEAYPDGFLDRLEEDAERQKAKEEEARKRAERQAGRD